MVVVGREDAVGWTIETLDHHLSGCGPDRQSRFRLLIFGLCHGSKLEPLKGFFSIDEHVALARPTQQASRKK